MQPTPLPPDGASRECEIHKAMDELGSAINSLEKVATSVDDRLGLVMRPVEPQDAEKRVEAEPACGLALSLHGYRLTVARIALRLESILDRLEI